MIYVYDVVLEIAVAPCESGDLAYPATRPHKDGQHGQPFTESLVVFHILRKRLLLPDCQSVSFAFLPIIALFDICDHAIRGVCPDISVTHRRGENGMKNRVNALDRAGFKS